MKTVSLLKQKYTILFMFGVIEDVIEEWEESQKVSGCFVVASINIEHMINRAGLTYGWMYDQLSLGRKS